MATTDSLNRPAPAYDKGDAFDFEGVVLETKPVRNLPGRPGEFELRAATEGAYLAYRNAQSNATKVDDGKFVGVGNLHDADAVLLGACLFSVTAANGNRVWAAVGPAAVKQLPRKVAAPMLAWVKDVSGLGDKAAGGGDPADPKAPPAGSTTNSE